MRPSPATVITTKSATSARTLVSEDCSISSQGDIWFAASESKQSRRKQDSTRKGHGNYCPRGGDVFREKEALLGPRIKSSLPPSSTLKLSIGPKKGLLPRACEYYLSQPLTRFTWCQPDPVAKWETSDTIAQHLMQGVILFSARSCYSDWDHDSNQSVLDDDHLAGRYYV